MNDTRSAKLSLAGVELLLLGALIVGGFGDTEAGKKAGVDLPEIGGVGRNVG